MALLEQQQDCSRQLIRTLQDTILDLKGNNVRLQDAETAANR